MVEAFLSPGNLKKEKKREKIIITIREKNQNLEFLKYII